MPAKRERKKISLKWRKATRKIMKILQTNTNCENVRNFVMFGKKLRIRWFFSVGFLGVFILFLWESIFLYNRIKQIKFIETKLAAASETVYHLNIFFFFYKWKNPINHKTFSIRRTCERWSQPNPGTTRTVWGSPGQWNRYIQPNRLGSSQPLNLARCTRLLKFCSILHLHFDWQPSTTSRRYLQI